MRRVNSILSKGILIFSILLATVSLAQDEIVLKSGEIITGEIIKGSKRGITVEIMEGQAKLTVPQAKILEVRIEEPELFKMAEEYYRRGKYDTAFEAYKSVAQKYGGYSWGGKAYLNAAQCLVRMENFSEAAKLYQGFIEDFPQAKLAPRAGLALADIYLMGKDYARAMRIYERLIKDEEAEVVAQGYYGMGNCYFQQEKFEEALICYLKVVVLYYDFQVHVAAAQLKSAECYQALSDDKRAMESYEEVIKKFPGTDYARRASEALVSLKEAKK